MAKRSFLPNLGPILARVVFLGLIIVPISAPAQEGEQKLRVSVLPVSPSNTTGTVETAVATTANTAALVLRLLGNYAVTEIPFGAYETAGAFLADTEPGELDRLLSVSISTISGTYLVTTSVIDPLSGEVLITREATAAQALDLFETTDDLLIALLGELSGRRIAFGEIAFEAGRWDLGAISSVDWTRLAFTDDPNVVALVDIHSALEEGIADTEIDLPAGLSVEIGAVPLGSPGSEGERVLVGTQTVRMYQTRSGTPAVVFEHETDVTEGQITTERYDLPVLTDEEAATLHRMIDAADAAHQSAQMGDDPAAEESWVGRLQSIRSYCTRLSADVPVLERILWRFDALVLAAEAHTVLYTAANEWNEPREQWLSRLSDIRSQEASFTEEQRIAATAVESVTIEVTDAILPLFALNAIHTLEEDNWELLHNRYERVRAHTARSGFSQPVWLTDDLSFIADAVQEYESEVRHRPGLYRVLRWGGAVTAIGGGVTWGLGLLQTQENASTFEDYNEATDPARAADLREQLEADREMATLFQGVGIGVTASGLTSVLSSLIIQRTDQRRPEKQLLQRLQRYFDPRLTWLSQHASGERVALPIEDAR